MIDEDCSMVTPDGEGKGLGVVKSFSFPDGEIRGDTFYIKHLSNNFTVIDCFLKDEKAKNADRNNRRSGIISEIKKESVGRVCRFISTHPDNDHILGIEELDKEWPIRNFYSVENDIPKNDDVSLSKYIELKNSQKCPLRKHVVRKWLNKDGDGHYSSGITVLWPKINNAEYREALKKVADTPDGEPPKPNNISCVLLYRVKGGASYLWMGDMESDMQKEFFDECKNELTHIDVLFHPHHGRESSRPPAELFEKLSPLVVVIGNAPDEHLNRDHPDLTITQNMQGDVEFVNDVARKLVHVYTAGSLDNMPKCLQKYDDVGKRNGLCYRGSFMPK